MQDWRAEHRDEIDAVFARSTIGETDLHSSPSGRFELAISQWHNEHGWSYSQGIVRGPGQSEIATIRRNYPQFPFLFFEDHSNGHDYLICGQDYQGQTIVELDTGARVDHLPDEAERGLGFCWAAHFVSPDHKYLIIEGCYWACPYEIAIYDFTKPLAAPQHELHRFSDSVIESLGFDDDRFVWTTDQEIRASDAKPFEDLSEDETRAMLDEEGRFLPGIVATRSFRNEWRAGDPFDQAERTEILPS